MWNRSSCFKWSLFQVNRINAVIPLCRTAFPSLITALSHFLAHQVIDTPDVFNLGEDDAGAELMFKEWEQLIVSPGPTAIIFTVRLDVRFTPNDYQLYKRYRELLPKHLRNNVILGFTRVDNLPGPVEDQITLSSVQTLISDCKGRYVTFRTPSDGQIVDKIIGWITETDTGGSRDTGVLASLWSGVCASIGKLFPTGPFNRSRTV